MRKGSEGCRGVKVGEAQPEVYLHFLHFVDLCKLKRSGRQQMRLPFHLDLPYQTAEVGRSCSQ